MRHGLAAANELALSAQLASNIHACRIHPHLHTSAYVSIRQHTTSHTSAHVSIRHELALSAQFASNDARVADSGTPVCRRRH